MVSDNETLRDTFAAAAMTGIIASSDDSEIKQPQAEFLSRQAWLVADAMLRERARNGAPAACETVPLTLTAAERGAMKSAIALCEHDDCDWREPVAATLRSLLARLGGDA